MIVEFADACEKNNFSLIFLLLLLIVLGADCEIDIWFVGWYVADLLLEGEFFLLLAFED